MEADVSQSQLDAIRRIMTQHGVDEFGFAELDQPLSLDRYQAWIQDGFQGDMSYLERHLPIKQNPQKQFPQFRSAIVFRHHYFNYAQKIPGISGLKVALYAQSFDYHQRVPSLLEPLLGELKNHFPDHSFDCQTDSAPILERDLAYRAGLGWFGKNSMLIDEKKGSFFFIGEVLTTLNLRSARLHHPDRCGTCTRCIDACPTDAILEGRKLDARKCISYLNIESKTSPSLSLRESMGDLFFGCDICQLVCPWNEKIYGKAKLSELAKVNEELSLEAISDLRWLLEADDHELKSHFANYPMARPKPWGLRRNALVIVGNYRVSGLKNLVERHSHEPRLAELAHWVLERLSSK